MHAVTLWTGPGVLHGKEMYVLLVKCAPDSLYREICLLKSIKFLFIDG